MAKYSELIHIYRSKDYSASSSTERKISILKNWKNPHLPIK